MPLPDHFEEFFCPFKQLVRITFRLAFNELPVDRSGSIFPGRIRLAALRCSQSVLHGCFDRIGVKPVDLYGSFPLVFQHSNCNVAVKQRPHQREPAAVHVEFFLFAFTDRTLCVIRALSPGFIQDQP